MTRQTTMVTMATSYKCYLKVKDCRQERKKHDIDSLPVPVAPSVAIITSTPVSSGNVVNSCTGAYGGIPSSALTTKTTRNVDPRTTSSLSTSSVIALTENTTKTVPTNITTVKRDSYNGTVRDVQQQCQPKVTMPIRAAQDSVHSVTTNIRHSSMSNPHSAEVEAIEHCSQSPAVHLEPISDIRDLLITIHVDNDESSPPLTNGTSSVLNQRLDRMTSNDILQQMKEQLHSQHGFGELENAIIKVKNVRGSHIPLNMTAVERSDRPRNALSVEICDRYSSVDASSDDGSLIQMSSRREEERRAVARKVCHQLENRLADLELKLAARPKERELYFEKQVEEISQRVDRLRNLINATNQVEWRGMIRRNPLW